MEQTAYPSEFSFAEFPISKCDFIDTDEVFYYGVKNENNQKEHNIEIEYFFLSSLKSYFQEELAVASVEVCWNS